MPKYEALVNLSAGKNLRPKKGDVVEMDEAQAAPFVAKNLLRALGAAALPVDQVAAPAPEVTEEPGEAEPKKGKGKGKK
jgi:hypothetical protein